MRYKVTIVPTLDGLEERRTIIIEASSLDEAGYLAPQRVGSEHADWKTLHIEPLDDC